ncbi:TetR/AcrR family transcriptional regulator [Sphingomonas sp. LaA6.9]|uniref:TetR/AcrR family transcriptional regulator n=1 Tax=Sphingomonas sp. LaA6.9 TaxID=2919914 RepID=UPI001F4FF606|nr:TetR/AcrR family transcriptional regulator [Sphingomonas sp. LaA6.9]MCJ8156132.1 TetR/AcrR family transcriptional regulator [Sphingomonas sp. LaA6.9]
MQSAARQAVEVDVDADTSDRTHQIVAAAYELLDEAGLEGMTIRAVLNRTGLARRAFYDRFAGKDDLVLAVFANTLRLAATYFGEQVRALPDPMARLKHIVTGIVLGRVSIDDATGASGDRRAAALSREHLRLAEARPAELQKAVSPLIDLIAGQLSDGIAAAQVREAPVQWMAMLVYNLVSTTVHTELLSEEAGHSDPQRRQKLADEIWEFCRRAIAA